MFNLAAIPGILSFIQEVIVLVESAFPNAKSGSAKLAAAVSLVQAATDAVIPVATITNTINSVVSAMNTGGTMPKSGTDSAMSGTAAG